MPVALPPAPGSNAPPVRVGSRGLRLNLGCGSHREPGFVNVDVSERVGADVVHDLEQVPWPFETDSVVEVQLHHVLEHLGADPAVFGRVLQELHRVCRDGAVIDVRVPHPRHDAYLADPTHVRPITLSTLGMLSKRANLEWQGKGHANTPLALFLDVDFEVVTEQLVLDPRWQARVDAGQIDRAELEDAVRERFNVVEEIRATLQCCKDSPTSLAQRCLAAGDAAGCIEICLRTAEATPDDPGIWYLLASAMLVQKQWEGAELGLQRTLALDPEHVAAWSDLAVVLRKQGRPHGAMQAVEQALGIDPTHTGARVQWAHLLAGLGRFPEAIDVASGLVQEHPTHAGFRSNLGNALRQDHRLEDALTHLQLACDADPGNPSYRWNLALALFQAGHWEEAFQAAEARTTREGVPPASWTAPAWDGAPDPDRTILLDTEQGLGDALQFARFAHDASRGGTHVVLRCAERLVPLLSTAPGVTAAVARDQEVAYSAAAHLMSVPAILRYGRNEVRRSGAYLATDPARTERWASRLPDAPLTIGVCWQGNPDHENDRTRSFPLQELARLAAVPRVALVSLQQGPGVSQLDTIDFEVHQLGPDLDADGAFLDTAAVMSGLDLVVSCDTAIGHLAGALDLPCFLGLAYAPCWRWQPGAATTPWYRHHTLFHQPQPGAWESVFEAMARAISSRVPA